jgi:uncharacterized BrkB/YihY/UPF0761 family membrane protein
MLNFAEQTGSGAVIVVWSFLFQSRFCNYTYIVQIHVLELMLRLMHILILILILILMLVYKLVASTPLEAWHLSFLLSLSFDNSQHNFPYSIVSIMSYAVHYATFKTEQYR